MIILLLIAIGCLLFSVVIRPIYLTVKFGRETGICVPEALTRDVLMQILQRELDYPGLEEIFYNEDGMIALDTPWGIHTLRVLPGRVYVEKGSGRRLAYIQEAECLKAYIQKIFEPDAPVDPVGMHASCSRRRTAALVCKIASLAATVILTLVIIFQSAGGMGALKAGNVYISQYSTTVTVRDAFHGFFTEPEWVCYRDGAQELVDFRGKCRFGEDRVTIIVTFRIDADTVRVSRIRMDGRDIPDTYWDPMFKAIYGIQDADGMVGLPDDFDREQEDPTVKPETDAKPEDTKPQETTVPEPPTEEKEELSLNGYVVVDADDVLNIRKGPGVEYDMVGSLEPGKKITILELQAVGSATWGRISKGWVNMAYVYLGSQPPVQEEDKEIVDMFAGRWGDQYGKRATMEITYQNGKFHGRITWGNSAASYDEWTFTAQYNPSADCLEYKDGKRSTWETDYAGNSVEICRYKNGTGHFVFWEGYLTWVDDVDDAGYGCEFARLP